MQAVPVAPNSIYSNESGSGESNCTCMEEMEWVSTSALGAVTLFWWLFIKSNCTKMCGGFSALRKNRMCAFWMVVIKDTFSSFRVKTDPNYNFLEFLFLLLNSTIFFPWNCCAYKLWLINLIAFQNKDCIERGIISSKQSTNPSLDSKAATIFGVFKVCVVLCPKAQHILIEEKTLGFCKKNILN